MERSIKRWARVAALTSTVWYLCTATSFAQQVVASPTPQPLDDAWWTGPMLAASAATLPQGHMLVEPYLFDVKSSGSDSYGSLTYINYGITDRFTVGFQPTASYTVTSNGPSSSSAAFGDTTLIAQYGITRYHAGSATPTTAVVVQESIPTGRYDRLGRASDGTGNGSYTTSIGLYAQEYFWLPNRRILRGRLDLLESFSQNVAVHGMSVYGTDRSFHGFAYPGSSFYVDAAAEYSATRSWVPALDITYRFTANTALVSNRGATTNLGSSVEYGFAPAIEYNWSPNWGVLLGTRFIPKGHNVTPSTTPAIAINFFH